MADAKITQLTELETADGADLAVVVDDVAGTPTTKKITLTNIAAWLASLTQTLTNKTLTSPVLQGNIDGWVQASETWEFVSVDDPTGVFRVNADVTTKYSAGMRIKMTNGGNVIYGIITVVGSYSGGYTNITFLHQIDPTDNLALYLMANSAITINYYSSQKAPVGFNCDISSWSIEKTDTTRRSQSSPTTNTVYNFGSISISIPIGSWDLSYKGCLAVVNSGTPVTDFVISLSTANNSISNNNYSLFTTAYNTTSSTLPFFTRFNIKVASKTTYYLVGKVSYTNGTVSTIEIRGESTTTSIKLICAYL